MTLDVTAAVEQVVWKKSEKARLPPHVLLPPPHC